MKTMRKICMVVALCGILSFASCGGGTSSPEQSAINSATSAFDAIVAAVYTCIGNAALTCACPGGGFVAIDGQTSLTFVNCVSSGQLFNGIILLTGGTFDPTLDVDMEDFGDCTDVTGNVTVNDIDEDDQTCSGTLSGTCASVSITCSMSSNCENCNI